MNKPEVRPAYLPPSEREKELSIILANNLEAYKAAVKAGDPVEAEKILIGSNELLTELHMIHPDIATDINEELLKIECDFLNEEAHAKKH